MTQTLIKRRMRIMLITLALLFGAIFAYKMIGGMLFARYMANHKPVSTVSTTTVRALIWPKTFNTVATLRAIKGVNVTSEVPGIVQTIYFSPGQSVEAGTRLLQLRARSDNATLNALQANTALAQVTLTRDTAQFAVHAISKATLDADKANLKNLQAQTAAQAAIVNKKTILAPFAGRLGISAVNPGQFLDSGNKIVTLQQLNPIYADFLVPQHALAHLKIGQRVTLLVDTYPKDTFQGKITTINPIVDTTTRNVEVEAVVHNEQLKLLPGMFATLIIDLEAPRKYLTLPATAISFNPYGSIVYIVNKDMTVTQKFVTTGEETGDRVKILQGLKEGDEVVSAGQLKLKNGSSITINNTVPLPESSTPVVKNEH